MLSISPSTYYVSMFACAGLPDRAIEVPVLAICGAHDAYPMRHEPVREALAPLCSELTVLSIADAGHYPMQEAPPLLAAHLERFLRDA